MTASSPVSIATVTGFITRRLVGADDVDERARRARAGPRRAGTTSAPARVSTSMRAFTNAFGHSTRAGFGTSALSRSVAVVWLTWLSSTASLPVASCCVSSRFQTSTGTSPRAIAAATAASWSCGTREEHGDRIDLR